MASVADRSQHEAPAYVRIVRDMMSRISQGRWPVGTMLPARQALAREYGVALATVQRAIGQLMDNGTLMAHPGRGTFVALAPGNAGAASVAAGGERQAPASPAMARRAAETAQPQSLSNATVAIIAPVSLDQMPAAAGSEAWEPLVVRALERVVAGLGGRTGFVSLAQSRQGRRSSWGQAIRDAAAEGASATAVIEVYDYRDAQSQIISAAAGLPCPLVYVTWRPVPYFVPHVYYDARQAGYQAAEHLVRVGYRRLVFLQPFTAEWVANRLAGARDAVRRLGLPEDSLTVWPRAPGGHPPQTDWVEAGYRVGRQAAADRVLFQPARRGRERTGIIAVNDHTAYGLLRAAGESGRAAGRDFGIIGFDDAPQSRLVGLTSVRPPLEALGEEAGHLLARALLGDASAMQVSLRSLLVPRASTCPTATGSTSGIQSET
jgi:DNA-binding LacI/PurR family transcriptional regulator